MAKDTVQHFIMLTRHSTSSSLSIVVLDISILLHVFLFLFYTGSDFFTSFFNHFFLEIVAYTVLFFTAPCILLSPHIPSSAFTSLSV